MGAGNNGPARFLYFYRHRNRKTVRPTDISAEQAASTFAATGSEQRLSVLAAQVRVGPEGPSIGLLGDACGVTGSTLTHHMRILTQAGLVSQVRQGRSIICAAVDYGRVQALSAYLLRECCADCGAEPGHGHD